MSHGEWMDISRSAASYYLQCSRIADGDLYDADKKAIKELGDYISKICKKGIDSNVDSEKPNLFAGSVTEGAYLALRIEKECLQKSTGYESEYAKGLRKLKIDSLDKLAEVLVSVEDHKKFKPYAKPLADLFNGWKEWAEELSIPRVSYGFVGGAGISSSEIIGQVILRFPTKG
ncbi:hypothetical protein KY312_04085 [Candidatus Woesearchaeota archaeon]|nr:hypothetical protein [Candidatus Woesearchaeota archaeon]